MIKQPIITIILALGLFSCASQQQKTSSQQEMKSYKSKKEGRSRFKAISKTFKSVDTAYQEIHDDCEKVWTQEFDGNLLDQNASFAVEILTIDKQTSFLSALCVATTYEIGSLDNSKTEASFEF